MTEAIYDLSAVELHRSSNPYIRFRELLPVSDDALLPRDAAYTPTIHARRLGAWLGLPRLYLKNETVLPTGTTKDRVAAVALPYLYECGVRSFCTSSTGNSSTAYAQAIRRFPDDFRMVLFTASDFRDRVQYEPCDQVTHYVLRGASFVEAFAVAGAFARRNGIVSEQGFFNLGRREGLKLAWLEAVDQVPGTIDWYVQAVSSAMGVWGVNKAAWELCSMGRISRPPRLLCVQQQSCAPMARAWASSATSIHPQHVEQDPSGIAQAILRGDPTRTYPFVHKIVAESRGAITSASEARIREARRMVEDLEGVSPCFSAATALAGLIGLVRQGAISRADTFLVNLTGSDRPAASRAGSQQARWLVRTEEGWRPETAPAGRDDVSLPS